MKLITKSQKVSIIFMLAILLNTIFPQPGLTQTGQGEFFEETRHWVRGEFLEYYNAYGGLAIFGYPISERFIDQGIEVQYFQKARMEWHPENPDPYRIQLGLLSDELKYRQPPIPEPPLSRRKVYFAETGHTVTYAFLDYFKANGGIDIFGYPVTEMYFEEGVIVQYFQRLKMEWHPNDTQSTVRIGNLGEVYISLYGDRMPSEALRPASPDARPDTGPSPTEMPDITGLRAVVSLRYSVMSKKRSQTVSVLVTDTNGDPRPDAEVVISFHESVSGQELMESRSPAIKTDSQGYMQVSLPINEGRSGSQIIVRATATYKGLSTNAQNVFLLWW